MHEDLARLRDALCQGGAAPTDVDRAGADRLLAEAVIVLPAGGFGYRMRSASDGPGAVTQKSLLPLPNGETLIGRLVREYAAVGARRFVALVNHAGEAVEGYLDGGTPWGVEVRCSYDPSAEGSGRTGALVHAMNNGVLVDDATLVIHNADCQIIRYSGSFPRDLAAAHLWALRERNATATLAAVDGSPYAFTGMSIADGRVTGVEMYPFIPVPTHTGITVVTAEALAELRANALGSKQNFERDMFPRWAADGRLAAMMVGHEQWVAVDDRKAYQLITQALTDEI